ncbi:hypothetical protein CPB84DRAFT_219733 [Gymnopilus junonius]|uniref:Uncharacterized protein n=1 Tax=Gymnopilus junonius TaxID=109634 RepID=A0A9P5NGQ1_GYMJU|nr:hypothetical protein CPB84DRAFT_219733 [Gymnopilus junonius]
MISSSMPAWYITIARWIETQERRSEYTPHLLSVSTYLIGHKMINSVFCAPRSSKNFVVLADQSYCRKEPTRTQLLLAVSFVTTNPIFIQVVSEEACTTSNAHSSCPISGRTSAKKICHRQRYSLSVSYYPILACNHSRPLPTERAVVAHRPGYTHSKFAHLLLFGVQRPQVAQSSSETYS